MVPDAWVPMTKSFLQNFVGTLHDFAFANLSSSSPERWFICLASMAAAAVLDIEEELIVKPKSEVQSPKVKTKRTWADTKITRVP